jgi:uncharacterized protein (TIGR03086 family)
MTQLPPPTIKQLARALAAVDPLVSGIQDDQWSAPTPCTDWTVRQLIVHLVGMNRVFIAAVNDEAPPDRSADPLGDDPVAAYRDSGEALRAAFDQPGVLERTYQSPLGSATGAVRLRWRIADLLAHSWDLSQALGQPVELPEDLVEQALVFAQAELPKQSRTGRFDAAQPVADDAPAIDRLVAFLGRSIDTERITNG